MDKENGGSRNTDSRKMNIFPLFRDSALGKVSVKVSLLPNHQNLTGIQLISNKYITRTGATDSVGVEPV